MSRENLSKILSGIDPAFVDECTREPRPSERDTMKYLAKASGTARGHSPRRLVALVAAACLLAALAITAYANENIRSAIEKYWNGLIIPDSSAVRERGMDEYADWLETQEAAKEKMLNIAAEATQENTFVPITEGSTAGITLLESYYNGTDLALGCQFIALDAQPQLDVDLDDPAYADLSFFETSPWQAREEVSEELRQEIEQRLTQGEKVGVLVTKAELKDHVYAGETDLGCIHSDPDENGNFIVDPSFIGNEYTLPEECQNLPEITVTLRYTVGQYLYVMEGDACSCAYIPGEIYPISFTIANRTTDNS